MEDCPGQPEDAKQDNKIHPGKSAFDFRSSQLCGGYFHFDGNPNISKLARWNNPIRVTVSRLFQLQGKSKNAKGRMKKLGWAGPKNNFCLFPFAFCPLLANED